MISVIEYNCELYQEETQWNNNKLELKKNERNKGTEEVRKHRKKERNEERKEKKDREKKSKGINKYHHKTCAEKESRSV